MRQDASPQMPDQGERRWCVAMLELAWRDLHTGKLRHAISALDWLREERGIIRGGGGLVDVPETLGMELADLIKRFDNVYRQRFILGDGTKLPLSRIRGRGWSRP
jgi:hypothetical protein